MFENSSNATVREIGAAIRRDAKAFAARHFSQPLRRGEIAAVIAALTGVMAFADAEFNDKAVVERAMARLRDTLRRERKKARAGHPGYDFSRHLAMHQAIKELNAQIQVPMPETHKAGASAGFVKN